MTRFPAETIGGDAVKASPLDRGLCMVQPRSLGTLGVNLQSWSGKSALLAMAVLLLAIGGCGRKSGLDAPPQASVQQPGQTQVQPDGTVVPRRNSLGLFDPEEEEKPVINSRPQRRIFLDKLLD